MSRHVGPERVGAVLRDWLEATGLAGKLKHLELYAAWEEVVGAELCRHARVAGFAHHKLYVDVDSAAHLQELRSFYKAKILADLRDTLPNIVLQDIVFRPAPLHER